MKASFVVMLLTLCLCARAVELPYLGNTHSFREQRNVLAAAFNAKDGRAENSVSKQNTSHFYPVVEYGYYRTGTSSVIHFGVSLEQCIKYCVDSSHGCLAVNYHAGRLCYEFKALSSYSTNVNYATVLVQPKAGDDPCSSAYMFSGRQRADFYYEYFLREEAPNAHECCARCREDSESRCKAWNYYVSGKTCYLLDATSPMKSSSSYVTGYAVVDPREE